MLGEKMNKLNILDENNGKVHNCEFDDICSLYDGEMVILDLFEIGYRIAESLEKDKRAYDWDEVEREDIMNEIEGYFDEILDSLINRIEFVLDENGIKYEVR